MAKFKVGDRVTAGDNYGGAWKNLTIVSYDPLFHACYDAKRDEDGVIGAFQPTDINLIQPTQPTIPTDIAERAIALVRDMAGVTLGTWTDTARAILADLEPVSVDLLAARECVMSVNGGSPYTEAGDDDDKQIMQAALAAIAKGRQLEREERK